MLPEERETEIERAKEEIKYDVEKWQCEQILTVGAAVNSSMALSQAARDPMTLTSSSGTTSATSFSGSPIVA